MTRVSTVLVTGSLGYLGSRLTPYLSASGWQCRGYDTGFFRTCTLTPPADAPTRRADARDFCEADLEGIDAVVHLADISNDPLGILPAEGLYRPTRDYTLMIAEQCKRRGVRFVFASSCSVYGMSQDALVTEESATAPQTLYSWNKLDIEHGLQAMADASFCPVILRFATVFGPSSRMRFDLSLNMFVGMALTSGRIFLNSNGLAWRPHVYIEDVCETIRRCLEQVPRSRGALILNVGRSDQNFQVLEAARIVQAYVPGSELAFLTPHEVVNNRSLELVRDRKIHNGVDTRTYRVSFDRLEQTLEGFRCQWTVEAGVAAMVRNFKQLGLHAAQVADPRFYRLQHLEGLVERGQLSSDLRWTVSQPAMVQTSQAEASTRCR